MFHTLLASGSRPSPGMPRLLASIALHGIVVAAVVATQGSAPAPHAAARESSLVFIAPQQLPRSLPPLPELGPSPIAPAPSWTSAFEAPKVSAGQLMTAPLPRVNDLLSLPGSRSALTAPVALTTGRSDAAWAADSVDEPVEVLDQAPLRYPAALAQAGIPGRVEMEFVVDTSGRAEGGSVRTLASTRPEFEAAARAAIMRTRYRPARAHGFVVRQLVRQSLSFRAAGR